VPSNSSTSIEDCIQEFQNNDFLQGSNKWYCKNCADYEETNKKTEIVRLPNYLIVHLKRFKDISSKNTNFVSYGESVNLQNNDKDTRYELYAKIKHMGGMAGGHYIAVAKQNSLWYIFNDSSVEETSFKASSDTYLLFYKRSSPSPLQ
jgi:ubiquitin C-terminal hydrolase